MKLGEMKVKDVAKICDQSHCSKGECPLLLSGYCLDSLPIYWDLDREIDVEKLLQKQTPID